MKIAYLGPKGSFSHHVVQTAFPKEELHAFANITDVIKAYEQGLVDYSVVPVEKDVYKRQWSMLATRHRPCSIGLLIRGLSGSSGYWRY